MENASSEISVRTGLPPSKTGLAYHHLTLTLTNSLSIPYLGEITHWQPAVEARIKLAQSFLIQLKTMPHDFTVFAAISVTRALTFTEEEYSGMS